MALPISIEELLSGQVVEWARLEFKEGWNPEKVLHTLCAFANDFQNWGGGYLLIGIAENRGMPVLPPAGIPVHQLDGIQQELLGLSNKIQPAYFPIVEPVAVQGKHVMVIWAFAGQNRPYSAPKALGTSGSQRAYFVRINSSTVEAKGAILQELLQLAGTIPFDDRQNQRARVKDLQLGLVRSHLQEVGSELFALSASMPFAELCGRLKIVDGPVEALRPRNVGILFFTQRPATWIDTAWIDVVELPQGPAGDTISEKRFDGPLTDQLRGALEYIASRFVHELVVKQPNRPESRRFFTYPERAIREALANAVYHRGYDTREPIEVRITPSAIQITSYPGPDASVQLDALRRGTLVARRYRNRRIGEFLKELHLTEERGTGVPKIIAAMASNGSPPAQFETDNERSYFSTILPIHTEALTSAAAERVRRPISTSATLYIQPTVDELRSDPRVRDILSICKNPASLAAIATRLDLSRAYVRTRYLNELLREGWLEYTNPNHPRARGQQYRTTSLGLENLKSAAASDNE